jgi:hypothetical protein
MPVHVGMPLALARAHSANRSAGLKLHHHELLLGMGQAGENTGGCRADIHAVQVVSDTLRQHFYIVFSETGIGTNITGISALDT